MSSAASWRGRDRHVPVVPPMQSFPRRRARPNWGRVAALTIVLVLCVAAWIGVAAAATRLGLGGPL